MTNETAGEKILGFYGGGLGAIAPFAVFLAGVAWLGLSGAPDERGFWPILVGALIVGTLLCRDPSGYAEAVVAGMSRPIVMLMVTAWLLAGVLGSIMTESGFVHSLIALAERFGVSGAGFVATSFLICAVVSTGTGTSLGTILICSPLLYPAGVTLGATPAVLIGAILGGATFGDNVSPVSDTTIASATTQGAELGRVVRTRLRYALPAACVAVIAALVLGSSGAASTSNAALSNGSLAALPMLMVPAIVIGALLARRHLVEGLLYGVAGGVVLSLLLGLISPGELMFVDTEAFIARGTILSGMERGIGVSVFTILLMGLVGGIESSGLVVRLIDWARQRIHTARSAEFGIFAAVSAAVLLTTHSTVAILTVGRFARETGEAFNVRPHRRANILDVTVCTYPFLLPFFIPTILASSTTGGAVSSIPRVSAFHAGALNFYSWGLFVVLLIALTTGWGGSKTKRD